MSQFNSHQLLTSLQKDITQTIEWAKELLNAQQDLNTVPQAGKWTIAQVFEHLNTYNNYYLPEIEKSFQIDPKISNDNVKIFKTGVIGGYLTKMMEPDASGSVGNKTKAFKKHIPAVELDAMQVLNTFIKGQEQFLVLVRKANNFDLNKVCIKMSISILIKLKLGDILRVLVVHQQRHFIQIREAQALIRAKHELQTN